MSHTFLSPDWIDAAFVLYEEYVDRVPVPDQTIVINQVITETPFGADPIEMHLDTTEGFPRIGRGHLDTADVTLTTDYQTARDLFVAGDQQVAMQAFMTGKIRLEGDVAKVLAMQAGAVTRSDLEEEIAQRLRDLTLFPDP